MERFLMHYGVPGMKRPKGLRYKTRGSISVNLHANRQRQMHGEDNEDNSESTGNKFLDIRKNQEKQAKEAKKTKEQIEKYRKDKAEDERSSKLMYTRETPHRVRYQEEVNSRKLGRAKNNVDEIAEKNNSSMAKLRKKKETAKESVRTAKQIEKYRKDKAEDEKWAKVRQEYKETEANKGKFFSNIRKDLLTKAALANRYQVKRNNDAIEKFNNSLGGKLQKQVNEKRETRKQLENWQKPINNVINRNKKKNKKG